MALAWEPWAMPGIFAGLFALTLASVVYATRPDQTRNRTLAAFLALTGLAQVTSRGLAPMMTDPGDVYSLWVVFRAAHWPALAAYLVFLGTLPTPLSRAFRARGVQRAVWAVALLLVASAIVNPVWWQSDVAAGPLGTWYPVNTTLGVAAVLLSLSVALYGLVVAVSAYMRARESSQRSQMRSYAIAFAGNDLVGVSVTAGFLVAPTLITREPAVQAITLVGPSLGVIWLVLWTVYAILRTQLFGIELRVKAGIHRSAIAGIFVVAFILVSETVERLVGVDGLFFGLAAAVAIGLVFRRIERWAARLADRLMPDVQDTPAYREARRLDIYRAALADAMHDGRVSATERRMLDGLQGNLGLSRTEAARIEGEVLATGGGA